MVSVVFSSDVFSSQSVVHAAHRHVATCFVEIQSVPEGLRVVLTPRAANVDDIALALQLQNDVLDEQVRARVREQTSALHAALVDAALRGALPKSTTAS